MEPLGNNSVAGHRQRLCVPIWRDCHPCQHSTKFSTIDYTCIFGSEFYAPRQSDFQYYQSVDASALPRHCLCAFGNDLFQFYSPNRSGFYCPRRAPSESESDFSTEPAFLSLCAAGLTGSLDTITCSLAFVVSPHANSDPKGSISTPRAPSPSHPASDRHMMPSERKPRTDSTHNRAEDHVEAMVCVVFETGGCNVHCCGRGVKSMDKEVD